jgi:hypothetical protein
VSIWTTLAALVAFACCVVGLWLLWREAVRHDETAELLRKAEAGLRTARANEHVLALELGAQRDQSSYRPSIWAEERIVRARAEERAKRDAARTEAGQS